MQTDKRNHLIDLLRIMAASWVVLFHINQPIKPIDNWYRNFCKYGHLGVPAFFVISGYCILIALQHAKKPTEFITRRFFRIFPPYWFSLIVSATIIVLIKLFTGVNSVAVLPKSLTGVLAMLTLTTTPITAATNINWVYWTLMCEASFYLVVFACSFLKKTYFTVALLIVTLLSIIAPQFNSGPLFFLHLWPLFSLGMATYQILHNPAQQWPGAILFALSAVAFYFTHQPLGYLLCSFIPVGLIAVNHFKPLKNNLLSGYGDISYSLYLVHVPIGVFLCGQFKTNFIQNTIILNILFDALVFAMLVFASGIMHRYIELPAIKCGKRFAK